MPTADSPAPIYFRLGRGWWITCNYPTVLKERNINCGFRFRAMFSITPKNAFISSGETSLHKCHVEYSVRKATFCICSTAYIFVAVSISPISSSEKKRWKYTSSVFG
jgi:hypothetical protein